MANIDLPPVEMYRRNQPIFVPPDVEHNPLADFIGGWEGRAESTKILKIGMLHNLEPSRQRLFAIWVLFPKLAQWRGTAQLLLVRLNRCGAFGQEVAVVGV